MKKKGFTILVIVLIIAIGAACLLNISTDYSAVLKANWGFSLPISSRYSEIYEKDSGSSFHGDGLRYHVFSYEYEDYIDRMFAWRTVEGSTRDYSTYSEAAHKWLAEIETTHEYYPDYEECLYWYMNASDDPRNEIIIFWDPEKNLLYILESFF